jgi:hypothetical protein
MVGDSLSSILEKAQAKADKEGLLVLPDGTTATLYVSHNGVGLTVSKVDAIKKLDGGMVQARTTKRETYVVEIGDLFAVALDGAQGTPARRAGFGA